MEEAVSIGKHDLEDSNDPSNPPKKLRMEEEENKDTCPESGESSTCSTSDAPRTQLGNSGYQTEASVGITQYLGKHNGFFGILKHRYSDFLVNEITEQKEIVHLTNLKLPVETNDVPYVDPSEVFSEDILNKVLRLSQRITIQPIEIKVTDSDKVARTKIHECLRQNYNNLKSFTKKVGLDNYIVVQYCKQGNERRGRWPSTRGNYTHFLLYKENTDTMEAIRTIANCLNMNPNAFTFAGTKDKRGKTCQRVSAYRVEPYKLTNLNNFLKTIKIGNLCYKKEPLGLGDLYGNHFVLIIRAMSLIGAELDEILNNFTRIGFINYFGLQRFGSSSVPTQDIGRCLVLGDWKRAVELVLEPRGHAEPLDLQQCRKIWWETRDANQALSLLHKKNSIEAILLKGLATHAAKDYLNALNRIPRNTRLLYLHSFQSYIWNYIVSLRITKFNLDPIEGDLILPIKAQKQSEEEGSKEPVVVTKEMIDAGSVTIYDVVLPLPGHNIVYPKNEVVEWYKEALAKDGLGFDSFKPKVKEYSLGGTYRHMLVKPENTAWSILSYNDSSDELLESDFDKLKSKFCPKTSGDNHALKLEFSLPSSCYATMAVREILKMQTTEMIKKPDSVDEPEKANVTLS